MADTDTIDVVLDDAPPPAAAVEQPARAPDPPEGNADELAQLRARIAEEAVQTRQRDEEIARLRAEKDRADQERADLINARFASNETAIANYLAVAQGDILAAEADYARLLEAGQYAEAARVNTKLNDAQGRLREGTRYKQQLDAQKAEYAASIERERGQAEEAARRAAEAPADPYANMHPDARKWIDAHPKFKSDAAYHAAALAAHEYATKRLGLTANTPAYFDYIDKDMAAYESGGEAPAPAPAKPAARTVPAAPPSRSTGGTAQHATRSRSIQLSAAQREMADISMKHIKDPAERYKRYAQNMERMNAEKPLLVNGA